MKIELGHGVDDIIFGMSENEIIEKIGAPDKRVITEYDNIDLYFYRLKLVLKIEVENENRLGWIEVHNKNATWAGNDPWSMEQNELLNLLSIRLKETHELQDYGSFESICFNENWVELQYELGELRTFNFGVLYAEDEEPLWPPKST